MSIDLTTRALIVLTTAIWVMVLLVAYPLGVLLGFKCPRCGEAYLATGGLGDFLGLGRILFSRRCGSCALPAPGHTHRDEPTPSSRPV